MTDILWELRPGTYRGFHQPSLVQHQACRM
jgi:hypothetical protein